MTFHVLVPDNVHPSALDVLRRAEGLTITAPGQMTRAELLAAVPDADALIIRSASKVDAEVLAAAARLKIVARAGVGVDNVDVEEATRRGVIVVNTPDGNTISTAEHAFGMMLALARHIAPGHISMREGKWDRKSFMGVELRGKTLGIVGFGRIGRAIAKRALAFEMTVISFDPYVPADLAADLGVEMVSLNDLFARSDFITLHAQLTDETYDMINRNTLAQMKRGVRLINAARGALINEHDLADAIKSGQVAGAALDVFAQEPPQPDNPLVGLPGVIHTPHLAASTEDAQIVVAVDAARLVVDALLKGEYRNVVNPAVLKA
ncbi:hydroxyacid dehydrogenase [Oscillatoria laete-virens NRMC-F 0139]|nr:hydroxyacid dehydrogenase [Oscillatoria laete-virens]MDL5053819.1 hydroxyacid dehydrogenase [Oscillatoria laete-virens NRMC-F 0139]